MKVSLLLSILAFQVCSAQSSPNVVLIDKFNPTGCCLQRLTKAPPYPFTTYFLPVGNELIHTATAQTPVSQAFTHILKYNFLRK